jgi:flagellar motor switch protein FliN
MTSQEALLRLGESTAEAIAKVMRAYVGDEVERGAVTVSADPAHALDALPTGGVATSVAYVDGITGGNVFAISLLGARKLAMSMMGMDPSTAESGPLDEMELSAVGELANQMMAAAAAATAAVLGQSVEIAPPKTREFSQLAEVTEGVDLSTRSTGVSFVVCGELCRLVQLVPNAFLVRMSRALSELEEELSSDGVAHDGVGRALSPRGVCDLSVSVTAELGRVKLPAGTVAGLSGGAVVAFEQYVDDPIELFVNGRPFARIQLLTARDRWFARIDEILPLQQPLSDAA